MSNENILVFLLIARRRVYSSRRHTRPGLQRQTGMARLTAAYSQLQCTEWSALYSVGDGWSRHAGGDSEQIVARGIHLPRFYLPRLA